MRICNCCNENMTWSGFYDECDSEWYCSEDCVPIHAEVFWTTFDEGEL